MLYHCRGDQYKCINQSQEQQVNLQMILTPHFFRNKTKQYEIFVSANK